MSFRTAALPVMGRLEFTEARGALAPRLARDEGFVGRLLYAHVIYHMARPIGLR